MWCMLVELYDVGYGMWRWEEDVVVCGDEWCGMNVVSGEVK